MTIEELVETPVFVMRPLTVAEVYAANIQRGQIVELLRQYVPWNEITDELIEDERRTFIWWLGTQKPFRSQRGAWKVYVSQLWRPGDDEPLFTHKRWESDIERTVASAIRPTNQNEYGGQQ